MDEKEKKETYEKGEIIKGTEGESERENEEKEEQVLRRAKIRKLKELIERGEYKVSPEEIAEKMLEFFRKNKG